MEGHGDLVSRSIMGISGEIMRLSRAVNLLSPPDSPSRVQNIGVREFCLSKDLKFGVGPYVGLLGWVYIWICTDISYWPDWSEIL